MIAAFLMRESKYEYQKIAWALNSRDRGTAKKLCLRARIALDLDPQARALCAEALRELETILTVRAAA